VRAAPDPCASARALALPPLPGSGAEVAAVADAWRAQGAGNTTVLTAAAASEANLKRAAAGRARAATSRPHGLMTGDLCAPASAGTRGVGGVSPAQADEASRKHWRLPRRPRLSPWIARRVLARACGRRVERRSRGRGNDGILTAEEAATLELRGTDWVVLSACHSGGGEPWSSAGRVGICGGRSRSPGRAA
jgi:hypothetical protein